MEAKCTILFASLRRLENALGVLNRRAKRLKVAPYELSYGAPYVRTRYEAFGENEYGEMVELVKPKAIREEVVDAVIVGETIKLAGWNPLARIDHLPTEEGEPVAVLLKFPGVSEDLSAFATERSRCDHCHVRRARAAVYLLRNDDGRFVVVGSTCLMDFTGHASPEALLALAADVQRLCTSSEDDDLRGEGGGGRGGIVMDAPEYLTMVAAIIRVDGWMSRGQSRESSPPRMATADVAWQYLTSSEFRKKYGKVDVTRHDRAVALWSLRWAARLDATNDYQTNIQACARASYLVPRVAGIAASIVSSWLRNREELKRRAKVNRAAHTGVVGKRSVFEVEVIGTKFIDGMYPKTMVKMVELATGALLVWWASGAVPDELRTVSGTPVKVKATVKKYDSYQGTAQTIVARLVVS